MLSSLSLSLLHFMGASKMAELLVLAALSLLSMAAAMLGGETSASLAPPCDFPAIFNFGDSNSDTGGLSASFGAAPPPNGETFFGAPMGRYCDGRLIVDFIAERLGLPYLHAYLDSVCSNFSHGANFATAGSTIRRQNTSFFQTGGFSPFSLDVQSWQFSQFKSRSQRARKQGSPIFSSLLPPEEFFARALYTFDIGQNDLTAGYFSNRTTEEVLASIPDILAKFVAVIEAVYEEGGRYFWIHDTGPFGCLPYILDKLPITAAQVDATGCAAPFNMVARSFNGRLKATVARLRRDLPLAVFTYVDVYSAKYSLFSHGRQYGFPHPLATCCGHGGKYNYNRRFGCGSTAVVNGTRAVVGAACDDPSRAVVWDGVHYTEAGNRWVFDQIAEGRFSDPPLPVTMACRRHPQ